MIPTFDVHGGSVDEPAAAAYVRLKGRVLFLTEDPRLIRDQLAGVDLPWDAANPARNPKLRDDVSTDEITPARVCFHFDERLGEVPYVGLRCGGEQPIGEGAVKRAGFVASVSGKRRGKGSSREQSPYAERAAGIRLIIGESIERIYRQNCQNIGVLTSDNFALIDMIRRGVGIPMTEFTVGEDEITQQLIRAGGLFELNVARRRKSVTLPWIETPVRPMTIGEKIIAKHLIEPDGAVGVPAVAPGDCGFVRTDLRFSHEYVTPMAVASYERLVGVDVPVTDPDTIKIFREHLTLLEHGGGERHAALSVLAAQLNLKQEGFARRQKIRLHGELEDRPGSEGICHALILESYALPGQLIVGSDSHTPHAGAIGCLAFGIGATDLFNCWTTKDVRLRVPKSLKVVIRGALRAHVTAKDLILHLLALPYVREGGALGKVVEYAGETVEALGVDERATMTNMAAEIGGFTGIVAPDHKVVDFLVERRGIRPEAAQELARGLRSDPDAEYDGVIEIDAARIAAMVAAPSDPGNGLPVHELESTVLVTIAYGGSCTAAKPKDMDMYARVLGDALREGKRVASTVELYIQFGSQQTRDYCARRGYLEIFRSAGARLIEPGCGACVNAGPGASTRADDVVISAQNRNFPGRSGPGRMYLASPLTVAASAVAGYITEYRPGEFE